MPKITAAAAERSRLDSPNIDLSSAENWLIRAELIEICKEAITERLCPQDLSYPRAFAGYPEVLDAFASFLNSYFCPVIPIEKSHLATAPGAASCLDALFYNICDAGDGVLIPGPYWSKVASSLPEQNAYNSTPKQMASTFCSKLGLQSFLSL